MSEQEINHQFGVIRQFIEYASEGGHKHRNQAIATALIRLDNLHDKTLEMAKARSVPIIRHRPCIVTKLAA